MPIAISGGAVIYALSQKGAMPMFVKDMVKLDPSTVRLWDGSQWIETGWERRFPTEGRKCMSQRACCARFRGKNPDIGGDIEVRLRSGEIIGFSRNSTIRTVRGHLLASQLRIGDCLFEGINPEPPDIATPNLINDDFGWFVGLYIAEGSYTDGYTVISGDNNETEPRLLRINPLVEACHGTCSSKCTKGTSSGYIDIRSTVLKGMLDVYVGGNCSQNKSLNTKAWQRSNGFLKQVLEGYLHGDGSYEKKAKRWKLCFCNNKSLSNCLRLIGSRLNMSVRLKKYKREISFRGSQQEITGYRGSLVFNKQFRREPDSEIIEISQSGAKNFWEIRASQFSLASGVLL